MRTKPPENDEEERQRLIQVLRETNGIVAGPRGAASKLGMDVPRCYRVCGGWALPLQEVL